MYFNVHQDFDFNDLGNCRSVVEVAGTLMKMP